MRVRIALATRRWQVLCLAVVIGVTASLGASKDVQKSTISGVISTATGEPVAGAFVRVQSTDSRLTFMVTSHGEGRYTTPDLLPGKYTVQSVGGDYQSSISGPLDAVAGRVENVDLVLSFPRKLYPPPKEMTDAEYAALMPEAPAKQVLLTKCVLCHGPSTYLSARHTRPEWEKTIAAMVFYLQQNPSVLTEYNAQHGVKVEPLSDQERVEVLDYLAKNFPPDKPPLIEPPPPDPNRHLPRTLVSGAESKYNAMTLQLPGIAVGNFAVDSHGIVWISEKTTGILGRLDPQSLTYARVATPPGNTSDRIFATVAVDPKGQVWFTSNDGPHSQWLVYDPASRKIVNSYDVPVPTTPGGDVFFNTLRFLEDGSVWATGTAKHRIVKLDTSTRKVTEYPLRTLAHPFGIVISKDKMIWYAEEGDNLIVRLDPNSGKMTKFDLPSTAFQPRRLAVDAEGNIWATTIRDGTLVKVDYRTGAMTTYPPPSAGPTAGIDVDKKTDFIWFSEDDAVKLTRFDPRTNTFLEFPLPSGVTLTWADPWSIQVDPSDGNRVWWNSRSGRIGYIDLEENGR